MPNNIVLTTAAKLTTETAFPAFIQKHVTISSILSLTGEGTPGRVYLDKSTDVSWFWLEAEELYCNSDGTRFINLGKQSVFFCREKKYFPRGITGVTWLCVDVEAETVCYWNAERYTDHLPLSSPRMKVIVSKIKKIELTSKEKSKPVLSPFAGLRAVDVLGKGDGKETVFLFEKKLPKKRIKPIDGSRDYVYYASRKGFPSYGSPGKLYVDNSTGIVYECSVCRNGYIESKFGSPTIPSPFNRHQQGVNNMTNTNDINLNVIAELAKVGKANDEFDTMFESTIENSELAAALRESSEQDRKTKLTAAAVEIRKAIFAAEETIKSKVIGVREARCAERRLLAQIADIERAKAYGLETMNFVPLLALVSGSKLLYGNPASVIPADWKPKTVIAKPKKR